MGSDTIFKLVTGSFCVFGFGLLWAVHVAERRMKGPHPLPQPAEPLVPATQVYCAAPTTEHPPAPSGKQTPPMTVEHLRSLLQGLPGDLPVLVQGYETGWDSIDTVELQSVTLYQDAEDWDGEYKRALPSDPAGHTAVLLIGRRGERR